MWDAVLKFSGVNLEALSDVDMYLFFEEGIQGGCSNIHKNYSKANHKYLGKYYDHNEKCIYLWYVDMNSLYPTVMVELVLTGQEFQQMEYKTLCYLQFL